MAVAVAVAACQPVKDYTAPAQPGGVILYGDSFADEAGNEFTDRMPVPVTHRHFGGLAVCDFLPHMVDDAEELRPQAVVFQFQGNDSTDCILGQDAVEKYRIDARTATAIYAARGVPVYWVSPIPDVGTETHRLTTVFREVVADARAQGLPVQLIDAGVDLRDGSGRYPYRRPCLRSEGPIHGCDSDGKIPVRTSPTDSHLCVPPGGAPCSRYSSGAVRFARSMAEAVEADLGR